MREKKKAAYQIRGEMLTQDDMHITEVVLSVKEVLKRPGSTGCPSRYF